MNYHDYAGETIEGRYKVETLLGRGGMGTVYSGRHIMVGKRVAIKFLHAEFTGNEEVVKRFYREAQAAATIDHSNIIDVMDVGLSSAGEPYLVMEYLEGESLAAMLKRTGPMEIAAACGVMTPALNALQAAHDKGIIHRDLKPDNIFLAHRGEGEVEVKLIDFGISKFTGATGHSQLTQTGTMLGTPAYMSPEQVRGDKEADARMDVYSMGVILYEMLTGNTPFAGENYNQLIINVLTVLPCPLAEIRSDIPEEVDALILAILSKNPAERPSSALELLESLKTTEEYGRHKEGLTILASGIDHRTFAGGDLGQSSNVDGTDVASNVFSSMSEKGTPGMWAETSRGPDKSGFGKGLLFGLVAVAVVIVAVVGILVLGNMWQKDQQVVPIVPVSPISTELAQKKPTMDEGVTVTIEGAPQNARIIYQGVHVPMNPFKVESKQTIMPLKVEADGFETFATSIVPSENRTVVVEMKPIKKKFEKRSQSSKRTSKIDKKAGTKSKVPQATSKPSGKKKFKKGKRGTKFGSDFE